jgi:antitoxin component YwqK of YwqJK toxin-antitoxin module
MKSKNSSLRIIFITISSLIIFFTACTNEDDLKSDLIMKDNLLYKIGEDKPFTGTEKSRVEENIIEYEVVDGIKQGNFRLYHKNGNIIMKGQIDNNKNTGKWQYFYQSGALESEGYFVDDFPEGRWSFYYPSGRLREEGDFIKGNKTGLWKHYDEEGNVIFDNEFTVPDSIESNLIN